MSRQVRPAAFVAVGLACVLASGVTALTAAPHPSAVPAGRLGRPGNPVVIRDAAFSVTGRAGTLVHVRLRKALETPHPADTRRFSLSFTGSFGAVTMRPERGKGAGLEVGALAPQPVCGKASCPNGTLTDSRPPNSELPPGDYVLALGGPVGSTVSYTLHGFEGSEPVTAVGHLYAVPYTTAPIPRVGTPPTATAYHADRGAWARPTIGHRMLAGIILGVHLPGGGGYDFALCPGSYGTVSAENEAVANARPTCSGYAPTNGSVVGRDPLAHPVPSPDDEYANVTVATAFGGFEGVTGGSYAVHCNRTPCGYAAVGFVLAVDA